MLDANEEDYVSVAVQKKEKSGHSKQRMERKAHQKILWGFDAKRDHISYQVSNW